MNMTRVIPTGVLVILYMSPGSWQSSLSGNYLPADEFQLPAAQHWGIISVAWHLTLVLNCLVTLQFYKNPMHKWLFIPRKWHNSQRLDLQKIREPSWLRNAWAFHTVHIDLRLGDLKKYKQYNSTELPRRPLCQVQSLVFWQWTFDLLMWKRTVIKLVQQGKKREASAAFFSSIYGNIITFISCKEFTSQNRLPLLKKCPRWCTKCS